MLALAAVAGLGASAAPAGAGVVVFSSSRCADAADQVRRRPPPAPFQDSSTCLGALWLVRDTGGELARVLPTGEPDTAFEGPGSWSPDGQSLLVGRDGGLAVIDLATRTSRQVTAAGPPYSDVYDYAGRFSPDGRQIAFVSTRPGADGTRRFGGDVWVVDRDGTDAHRLTDDAELQLAPRWSPDGRSVVFISAPPSFGQGSVEPGVYAADPGGRSAPVRIASGLTGVPTLAVTPSPDGRFVAISSFSGLVIARADGGGARALVTTPVPSTVTWAGNRVIFPLSDPKGSHLVSADVTEAQPELREVTSAPGSDHAPDWHPIGPLVPPGTLRDLAPIVALTGDLTAALPSPVPLPVENPLGFFAVSGGGRLQSSASVQRQVGKRCRPFDGRRLGRLASCRRTRWVGTGSTEGWAKRVGRLPSGRYRVRFRVADRRSGTRRTTVTRRIALRRR